MPTPGTAGAAAKRRGSMIRQLSLQGQPSAQSAGRRGLKKQLSEDDGRTRPSEGVDVAGQGWVDKAVTKAAGRPRPVKLAWADRRQDSSESPAGVEVVARKCPGVPRPCTGKAQRLANLPLLGDKDTLVYTRQQLAERLRRAWKEREKTRPNLDIFLAHGVGDNGVVSARSVADPGTPTADLLIQESVSSRSDLCCLSPGNKRRGVPEPVRAVSIDPTQYTSGIGTISKPSGVRIQASYFGAKSVGPNEAKLLLKSVDTRPSKATSPKGFSDTPARQLQEQNKIEIRVSPCDFAEEKNGAPAKNPALADLLDFKTFPVADASKKFGSDFASSKFQMKSIDLPSKRSPTELPTKVKHSRNKENMGNSVVIAVADSPRSDSSYSECSKVGKLEDPAKREPMEEGPAEPPPITASDRRASFRSSSLLNKTITSSFSSSLHSSSLDVDDDSGIHSKNEIRVVLTKNNGQRPPLTRTLSAPTQQRDDPPPAGPPAQTSPPKNIKLALQRRINQPAVSIDVLGPNEDELNALRDRIKSAPTRRKLKTAAARRKNKDKGTESSEDEKEGRDTPTKKSTRRRQMVKNGGDIVTMVSLVSPAGSDTEDSVIHVPADTWTEEKEETPAALATPPQAQQAVQETREASSFIIQKFVSLRKTNKTVSFQQQPPVNRSYSASFPSRRVPAGAPIIIPTPVVSSPALTPAQLQERDKRQGADSRGVKRRLVRTRSAPIKDDDDGSSDENSKTDTSTEPVTEVRREGAEMLRRGKDLEGEEEGEEEEEEEDPNREPEFKSAKERECWTLYRKMLEKGVSVSYDTVLRGMLTPTEYRLRKNHLLSSC